MKRMNWMPAALAAGFFVCGAAFADTSLEPRPAEMMPRAADSIYNDVAKLGSGYIAIGDKGHVLLSQDGKTWKQVPTPMRAMLNRMFFLDEKTGWAVGHDATVIKTTDGGKSWSIQHRDPEWGKPFYDILFLDKNHGIVVGANSVIKETKDGGQNWELLEPDFTFHGLNMYGVLQLADGTLVIGGEKGVMARSTDRGANWAQVKTPYAGSFFGMLPYGDDGVFVYGLRGNVYTASNIKDLEEQDPMDWDEFSLETITDNEELAKENWRYYPNNLKESLFGGVNLSNSEVLLVGVNGAVVRSENYAMRTLNTPIEATLGDALVTNEGLIAVGFGGIRNVPISQ